MHDQVTVIDQSNDREKYDIIMNNADLSKTNNPCSKQFFFQFVIQYMRQFQRSQIACTVKMRQWKKKDISLISVFSLWRYAFYYLYRIRFHIHWHTCQSYHNNWGIRNHSSSIYEVIISVGPWSNPVKPEALYDRFDLILNIIMVIFFLLPKVSI